MTDLIAFSVPCAFGKDGRPQNPQTKGSSRGFVVGGRAIITNDNPKNKAWAALVGLYGAKNRASDCPWDGAISMSLIFRMRRPAKMPPGRILPVVRPDIDKMTRSVNDALTGILYVDDAQIVQLVAVKEYADEPGVYIQIQRDEVAQKKRPQGQKPRR